jgi:hypothetical protein
MQNRFHPAGLLGDDGRHFFLGLTHHLNPLFDKKSPTDLAGAHVLLPRQ